MTELHRPCHTSFQGFDKLFLTHFNHVAYIPSYDNSVEMHHGFTLVALARALADFSFFSGNVLSFGSGISTGLSGFEPPNTRVKVLCLRPLGDSPLVGKDALTRLTRHLFSQRGLDCCTCLLPHVYLIYVARR